MNAANETFDLDAAADKLGISSPIFEITLSTRTDHFTDSELAKRWRCSTVTIWRLRKKGKLHSGKVAGGPNLTSPSEVARVEAEAGIDA
jgi:hypothetical protein